MYAIFVFVAITYILSIAVSLGVWLTGGHEGHLAFPLGVTSMFIPAIAVLVVRFTMGEKISSSYWHRFPYRYLPIALFLIPVIWHSSMVPMLSVLEGGLPWQDWLTPQPDGLYHSPESQGWGTLTTGALIWRIMLKAAVGFIIVSFLAFFEEIGWRAWLLPRLADRMGARRAVIAVSAIWALWHTPAILSGIHNIEGHSAALMVVLGAVTHISTGIVIGWLWLRTESIWMVTLAHGAMNNWGQFAFKFMRDFGEHDPLLLGAGSVAMLTVGSLLLSRGLPSAQQADASGSP